MKSKTEKRVEFVRLISQLILRAYEEHGIEVAVYWYHRTEEQQQELYAIGRTKELHRKRVTDCDGVIKKSKHQSWEAADLCVIDLETKEWLWEAPEAYETLGRIAFELGLRPGIDWGDSYHFEYREEA